MMTDLNYTCRPEGGGTSAAELAANAVMEQGKDIDSFTASRARESRHQKDLIKINQAEKTFAVSSFSIMV